MKKGFFFGCLGCLGLIAFLVVLGAIVGPRPRVEKTTVGERIAKEAKQKTAKKKVVLAHKKSGGWLNIDFIHTGKPEEEAKRCVRDQTSAEAVACFAFVSEEAYRMAQPVDAGNFQGPLCWDARWQRNKLGAESGGSNNFRPRPCP